MTLSVDACENQLRCFALVLAAVGAHEVRAVHVMDRC